MDDPKVSYRVIGGGVSVTCSDHEVLKRIGSELHAAKKSYFVITPRYETEGDTLMIKSSSGGPIVGENLDQVTNYLNDNFFAMQIGKDRKTAAEVPPVTPNPKPRSLMTSKPLEIPKETKTVPSRQLAGNEQQTLFEIDPETSQPLNPNTKTKNRSITKG